MKKFRDYLTSKNKTFHVLGFDGYDTIDEEVCFEDEIKPNDEFEFYYALAEAIDSLDALKVGETMYVCLNRDNEESRGVVIRTC